MLPFDFWANNLLVVDPKRNSGVAVWGGGGGWSEPPRNEPQEPHSLPSRLREAKKLVYVFGCHCGYRCHAEAALR